MSLSQMAKANHLAKVDSGRIAYVALPTAALVVVTAGAVPGAFSEIFNAAGAPQVDYWLCGVQAALFPAGANIEDQTYMICVGYGGIDGAANTYDVLLITQYPIPMVAGEANALGPHTVNVHWLPYPIRVPGGERMAVRIDNQPTGVGANQLDIDEFRVVLATVVGQ